MRKLIFMAAVLLLIAACAQPPYLYYGKSSHSYYKAVKKQDELSVAQYKASLEQVFSRSDALGIKVPPGLYCDYAMLLLKENRMEEAKAYFAKEKQNWQEAGVMVDFLAKRYGLD
jgi:hypothetical protein